MKIDVRHISHRYKKEDVLDDVTFTAGPGEIVAVIGLNGAGKTTLLRCLSTVAVPRQGEILCDGRPLVRSDIALRRRVFFLPDTPQLFAGRTVVQNLAAITRIYRADTPEAPRRAIEILRELDLLARANTPVHELSRGQQYKTALTAAVLADPDVWLLDEPFASGMDPLGYAFLRGRLRDAAARGRTVLYTTQLPEVAEPFSDRVAVLHGARLRALETVADIRSRHGGLEAFLQSLRGERP
ncbi:MAG: ABC transporter ATP-binding protein [Kiritimatiellaeota bacterium]|nr:ABC transporter ATP-binding protein [Kiritimatiellota bacterium]